MKGQPVATTTALAAACCLAIGFTMPPASATHNDDGPTDLCYDPDVGQFVTHESINNDNVTYGPGNQCTDLRDGNDTAHMGAGGNDTALGGPGSDSLHGDGGIDSLNGQAGHDTARGDAGADRMYGGNGDDTMHGNNGADNLFGGDFCDETDHWGFLLSTDPDYDITNACGNGGTDTLYGDADDDWLWESNSDNIGDNNVDYINGGDGNDHCIGEIIDAVVNCEIISYVS